MAFRDIPAWVKGNFFATVNFNPIKTDKGYEPDTPDTDATIYNADVVTSRIKRDGLKHFPVLDIDYEAELIPSTTPGHYHLYLGKEVTWVQYQKVLRSMANAGLIEGGYVEASIKRGYTAVRLPWRKKPKGVYVDELDLGY